MSCIEMSKERGQVGFVLALCIPHDFHKLPDQVGKQVGPIYLELLPERPYESRSPERDYPLRLVRVEDGA